jgi:glycosyltransferase involved in cell wall biosynthesis
MRNGRRPLLASNNNEQMPRILYITYDGLTDPLGQSQILPYLTGLSRKGFEFTILSFEKKERFAKEEQNIRRIVAETNIDWHPLMFTTSPPILSKIYDLRRMKRQAIALHRKKNFDIVHCRSYVAAQAGLLLKRKFGCRFVFDMRGFWADEKKDSGHWSSNFLYRKLYVHYKKLERKLLNNADAVISLTNAAKNEMLQWKLTADLDKNTTVIPCCADLEHFDWHNVLPEQREQLKQRLHLANAFPVIGYLGSIGGAYGVGEMVLFFSEVKKKYPGAKFLFLTKDDTTPLTEEIKKYSTLNEADIITGFARREEIPLYLSLMHASIFFYKPTYSRLACSPTKFAELSGMGIPVICNAVGDLDRKWIGGLHTVIDQLSGAGIVSAALQFKALTDPPRESIRTFALKNFRLEDGIAKYESVYRKLLEPSPL